MAQFVRNLAEKAPGLVNGARRQTAEAGGGRGGVPAEAWRGSLQTRVAGAARRPFQPAARPACSRGCVCTPEFCTLPPTVEGGGALR